LWRVQKGTADTRFLYDGDALVTEYDATGTVTARYVHGSNAAADDPLVWYLGSGIAAKRYFHPDRLGSIVTATNGASAPTINTYDEYGVPKAANVGRFQYTGQAWLPELGLYYYKARMYSPTLGRFLQVDPIGYGDQLNLYAYAADNPVNLSDSTGLANTCSRVDSTACSGDYEGSLGPGTGGSGLGVYRVTETSTYSSPAGPFSLSTSWLEIRGVSAALQFATPGNPLFRNATFRRAYTGGPDAASTSWWDAYALIDPGYHYLDTNIVLVLSGQYPGDRATVPARQYGLIGGKNDFYQRYTLIGPIYQKPAPLVLNGPRIFFSPTAHALYFAPFHGNPGPGVPTGFIRIRPDAR
jgi:RHS repeat-associated protein